MQPLRIVFAGTPDFAAASLAALLQTRHEIVAVLTQPDRPAGRGRKPRASPVKQLALDHGVPVLQPETLRDDGIRQQLADLGADVMVVVAYGLIIPPAVLSLPRFGCLNVHGSLLPRWRGAAPIQRAIAAGDAISGVTIMKMDEGLDTGPMLLKRDLPLDDTVTGGGLHDQLAALGAGALVTVLENLPGYLERAETQPEEGATYAHKLSKEEARLDWQKPAAELARQVRAFNPWPVAWTTLAGQPLRVWEARATAGHGEPGMIAAADGDTLSVGTGDGLLAIRRLQLPGKKAVAVADLLRGNTRALEPGTRLGND